MISTLNDLYQFYLTVFEDVGLYSRRPKAQLYHSFYVHDQVHECPTKYQHAKYSFIDDTYLNLGVVWWTWDLKLKSRANGCDL